MKRRDLLGLGLFSAAAWRPSPLWSAEPFPVRYRKQSAWEELAPLADSAKDRFECEVRAQRVAALLNEAFRNRTLPLDPAWLKSLGRIRRAQFWPLTNDRVRFEIASVTPSGLSYRTGLWRVTLNDNGVSAIEVLEASASSSAEPLFVDVTEQLFGGVASFRDQLSRGVPYWRSRLDVSTGIDVFGNCGIAVGDADGDGQDEIYVCQPSGLPNRLYRRHSDERWEDITEASGVGVLDATASALFLDLRNTGRQDLVVLTSSKPLLFLNEGEARYRHVSDAFRFAQPPRGTLAGMAAADYDRDGKLDLYICAYLYFQSEDQYQYPSPYHDAQNGPPNFLFRNRLNADGTGYLEDVTEAAGLNAGNMRYSFAAAWCDYNGDGWPDLYVANDFGRNNLYTNRKGQFRDTAAEAGVEDIGPGMSAAWFDYDGDGNPDLYVANMWTAAGQRVVADPRFGPLQAGVDAAHYSGHTKGNSLYRNLGNGRFEYAGAEQKVEMGRWAWSADGIDFDLDGVPEIYVTAGMITHTPGKDAMSFFWRQVVAQSPAHFKPSPAYENGWNTINQLIREDWSWNGNEPNVFYVRREGRYQDVSGISGIDAALDSRAFAVTDLDGDGWPDLLLKNRLGPQLQAFQNNTAATRRRIAIELRGTKSNRDAIGARVEVIHPGGRSVQWLSAGSGYISQHTKRLFFGIGDAEKARVAIVWPSGLRQELTDLPADHLCRITEGAAEYTRDPLRKRTRARPSQAVVGNNDLVFEPTWLLEPLPTPEPRNKAGFLCLHDGRLPDAPFDVIDLRAAGPDRAAVWSLFRRYLFDYRAPLILPLVLLTDDHGLVHKVYPSIPDEATRQRDLQLMRSPHRDKLTLPFAGQWYSRPQRNYFRVGAPFLMSGYPDHGLPYLAEALRRDPLNFKVRLAVGQIHLEAGRLDDAAQHLSDAAKLNTESPYLWNNLGGLELSRKNYTAALTHFEKALALNPDLPYALVNAGQVHSRLGNAAQAERAFRRALELSPGDADAHAHLGLLLAKQDRMTEAAEQLKKAIELRPSDGAAITNLAIVYVRRGAMNDAIEAFRYGIRVAPDHEALYLNLASLYRELRQPDRARSVLQELLDRRPGHRAALAGLAELDRPKQ